MREGRLHLMDQRGVKRADGVGKAHVFDAYDDVAFADALIYGLYADARVF